MVNEELNTLMPSSVSLSFLSYFPFPGQFRKRNLPLLKFLNKAKFIWAQIKGNASFRTLGFLVCLFCFCLFVFPLHSYYHTSLPVPTLKFWERKVLQWETATGSLFRPNTFHAFIFLSALPLRPKKKAVAYIRRRRRRGRDKKKKKKSAWHQEK